MTAVAIYGGIIAILAVTSIVAILYVQNRRSLRRIKTLEAATASAARSTQAASSSPQRPAERSGLGDAIELAEIRGILLAEQERLQRIEKEIGAVRKEFAEREQNPSIGQLLTGASEGMRSLAEQLGRLGVELRSQMEALEDRLRTAVNSAKLESPKLQDQLAHIENSQGSVLGEVRRISALLIEDEVSSDEESRAIATLVRAERYGPNVQELLEVARSVLASSGVTSRGTIAQIWGCLLSLAGGPLSRESARSDVIQVMSRLCMLLAYLKPDGANEEWRHLSELLGSVAEGNFQQRLGLVIPRLGEPPDPTLMNSVDNQQGVVQEIQDLGLVDAGAARQVLRKATVRLGPLTSR